MGSKIKINSIIFLKIEIYISIYRPNQNYKIMFESITQNINLKKLKLKFWSKKLDFYLNF
jgi:hypothetical protein